MNYPLSATSSFAMSSPDPEYLKWEATVGSIVPKRVSPGFVVLSYAISYIGALTTLELINRRTATKGLLNWSAVRSGIRKSLFGF